MRSLTNRWDYSTADTREQLYGSRSRCSRDAAYHPSMSIHLSLHHNWICMRESGLGTQCFIDGDPVFMKLPYRSIRKYVDAIFDCQCSDCLSMRCLSSVKTSRHGRKSQLMVGRTSSIAEERTASLNFADCQASRSA